MHRKLKRIQLNSFVCIFLRYIFRFLNNTIFIKKNKLSIQASFSKHCWWEVETNTLRSNVCIKYILY